MTAGNWIALGSMAVAFLGLAWGMLRSFVSRMQGETNKVARAVENFRASVMEEMKGFDERLRAVETGKVSHADWVRVATSQLNRMNRMSEQLAEVSGKIDASIGMAGAVNRIASAIERKVDHNG